MKEIIQRGAEAVLYRDTLDGKEVVIKERIPKNYRIKELDEEIRSQRTRREVRLLERAHANRVPVPRIERAEKFRIVMDFIEGSKVKDILNDVDHNERSRICKDMGTIVSKLHNIGIIHGDLTTSNFIVKKDTDDVVLIDFGLGKFERKIESKAVDLHLLFEALKSTHFSVLDDAWKSVLEAYRRDCDEWNEIEKRIEQIKKRRRYK
ncbi:MAG: Kae1-associated serine/threonine protein kinase [Candidatus Micrarchaeota archaeon]|nr:Kae1-associated serine/threonine protein kinase [Candidatus Micrarchaeota archaeon]